MTINSNKNVEIVETNNFREKLLELNPDLLFGVYDRIDSGEDSNIIELKLLENTLTAYPNQLKNLNIPDDCKNINILDINALRKGEISYLKKGEGIENTNRLTLVSNGVFEYIQGGKGEEGDDAKKHIITTLRDGGAADAMQRTTAGHW